MPNHPPIWPFSFKVKRNKKDEDVAIDGTALLFSYNQPELHGEFHGEFHFERAMGFQTLHKEVFKKVDAKLLEALEHVFRNFPGIKDVATGKKAAIDQGGMSWKYLMEAFSQTEHFERFGKTQITDKSFHSHIECGSWKFKDILKSKVTRLADEVASEQHTIIAKAGDWYNTQLDIDAEAGECILLNVETITERQCAKVLELLRNDRDGKPPAKSTQTQKFLDVGVIRIPDFDDPVVKVYRIQLIASYEMTLDKKPAVNSTIKADYRCQEFKPREGLMNTIRIEAQKALAGNPSGNQSATNGED